MTNTHQTVPTSTVLVSGATGRVGRLLVNELLAAGHQVRALTRDPARAALPPEAELVEGSLNQLPAGVFDGIDAAFVFPTDGAGAFAQQAAAHGVLRLVLLSSLAAAADHARDHGSASQLRHTVIEQDVRATGVAWTILRPGTFANNLLSWAHPIRYTAGVRGPYPTSAQAPIHEADVAAAAAAVLTKPGHENQIYALTGPEALTRVEQLDAIGTALGRELTFADQTPDEFAVEMAQYGVGDDIVKMLLDYWADTVDEPDVPRPPNHLIGRPAKTLTEWAHDHIADFQ
ncbi:SDR family oxidoreductase [uncultured Friedmanniella sp.]|uniref:SDR family oxidoreductase n=1 Tax=uncultured Friedmanniella sp. TaxID=335381 RepID=UPI0035CA6EFA